MLYYILTEVQCKEKWKNLLTAFARSMKKPPSGSAANNKRSKDYYLKDVMQFILPFMKVKPQSSNLKDTEDKDEQKSDTDIVDTDINQDNSDVSLHDETQSTSKESYKKRNLDVSQDKFNAPNTIKKRALYNMKTSTDEVDKCVIDYITSKKDSQTNKNNSDLDFFKSLLPDISKMTDYQKRQFKRRTLDTIDSILDDSPTQNTISYVQRPLSSYSGSSYSALSPEPPVGTVGFQQLGNFSQKTTNELIIIRQQYKITSIHLLNSMLYYLNKNKY